ncbi:MAG: methyltransferase domain-containing protein [Ilumatobacter sp.]|nr:methyltransferase domain-containing protein [Ilumatobacter sp.]
MADNVFDDPRVAGAYDRLEGGRDDLDHYDSIADEFGARSVLDVGCGTGVLAIRLAERGIDVTGLDPAGAMLDVARAKPGAARVRWVHGFATDLPPLAVDMATMTGNVAQVFLTDEEWDVTLHAIRRALTTDGLLVFETRDPARRAWEGWTPEATLAAATLDDGRRATSHIEVIEAQMPFLTFAEVIVFESEDGVEPVRSTSTLRFRSRSEVEASLDDAGFEVVDLRDAPDRPGREFVFVARRSS